ncbi:DUF5686 and carboxypeptidase regulatory-like domain-containing protein [Olivibacter sitiensis]|uniref:DUF5686 and carboxypeptidase regulatory-like domain-containing protein n=1 Tax=Olivibacter sitiensis TaxID=376470 RepID=UPI0004120884|nr:DUF5686 and carboxypeptidase regulatory-like domain-containing protein [Olivibacter sitiensis]
MRILLSIALFILPSLVVAQEKYVIKGKVVDDQGEAVAFASVKLIGKAGGTSANIDGAFQLALPSGSYQLQVSAVGFQPNTVQVDVARNDSIRIVLPVAHYMLSEVVIGDSEDPAYEMIRKAIAKKKEHLAARKPYSAEVYIKGLQRMLKAPKSFLGVNIDELGDQMGLDSNRRGIIYLSESESKITVNPPKEFREEMISSKVSGSNRAFSFNRASDMELDIYQNYQDIFEGLSPRPVISPIADQALGSYRYAYQGQREEDGFTIHKIKVTPRRRDEPLYKGDLYLVDGQWSVHSFDFLLDKTSGISFVDTLHIKQAFVPIENSWMPTTTQFDFGAGMLGFRFAGYYVSVYQNYETQVSVDKKTMREVFRMEKGVNERDSNYWASKRPIALTPEESLDYVRKDSIRQRNESPAYRDSIQQKNNRFKPLSFLLSGYTHRDWRSAQRWSFDAPMSSLLYNTVEGLAANYGIQYSKRIDSASNQYLSLSGKVRYGFSNKRLNANAGLAYSWERHNFSLSGGSEVLDLNNRGTLPVAFNGINTVVWGKNHMKLYEQRFAKLNWSHRLPVNVLLRAGIEWTDRLALQNSTDYTFSESRRRFITSNNPFLPEEDIPLFAQNQSMALAISASYNFSKRYVTYPSGRRYLASNYPTLTLAYKKGIHGVLGSDVDYDYLSMNLAKSDNPLGMYGSISYSLSAGSFLNNKAVIYVDRRHFVGTQTRIGEHQLSTFLNLEYYLHSTAGDFAEAHVEYNMSGMLLGKIPLVKKLKIQELWGLHYLHTSEIKHYGEGHVGLQKSMLRLMYSRSFGNDPLLNHRSNWRIGLNIDL